MHHVMCVSTVSFLSSIGPYLRRAPVILEKPDIVYVAENQPASITVTLNHVHAVVTWKRCVPVSLTTNDVLLNTTHQEKRFCVKA